VEAQRRHVAHLPRQPPLDRTEARRAGEQDEQAAPAAAAQP